jgi:hypothetical protein
MDSLLSLVPSSGQGHNGVKTDMKLSKNFTNLFAYLTTIATSFKRSCPSKLKTCSLFYEILLLQNFILQLVT